MEAIAELFSEANMFPTQYIIQKKNCFFLILYSCTLKCNSHFSSTLSIPKAIWFTSTGLMHQQENDKIRIRIILNNMVE